jgi:hypothetical protein
LRSGFHTTSLDTATSAMCFLALVMEAALEQVKAMRVELDREVFLARTQLPPLARKHLRSRDTPTT